MNRIRDKYGMRNSVKEALDNLPCGVCFFDANGILILCNRRMYQLAFLLMDHDLQTLKELREALDTPDTDCRNGSAYRLSDGSWWNFFIREIEGDSGKRYTEVTAFDISDLHAKQELLQEANEAKRQTVKTLEHIQDNVVAIAREEEILAMKMKLHNEFGYNLQTIRLFYQQGCPAEGGADFVAGQREMLRKIRGELGGSDEIDSLGELERLARALGMEIRVNGPLPERMDLRDILAEILRECLTNTIRHAEGNQVFLELIYGEDELSARVTNNGDPPAREITESGGLASLRKRIEGFGGTMVVRSLPEFRLEIVLPVKEEKI